VPTGSPFYAYLHNLYRAGIVVGYPCGGPGDPCVPPANLPYYRPGNPVTRLQMTKFIDLGRRNIADAVGTSLVISTTANRPALVITSTAPGVVISNTMTVALDARTSSAGEAIVAECDRAGFDCYSISGTAGSGNLGAYLTGGEGVRVASTDPNSAAVEAIAQDDGSFGGHFVSEQYQGLYARSDLSSYYSLYVDTAGGPTQPIAGLEVNGSIRGEGDLYIAGSKAGYVVDIMQNAGTSSLEPGDLVTIAGNGPPVLGQIPVVTVRAASAAYDTGVAGVVDQAMYVPNAATKAAYDRQQAARRTADSLRTQALHDAAIVGSKPDPALLSMPPVTISDEQGTLHALPDATTVGQGGYLSVVTLGSYKAVKVDASYGPIAPGDLLTTSPHAGYAMKVQDKTVAFGATIGKALGSLAQGTGTIPVLVGLR
jgi:hypothetical protein